MTWSVDVGDCVELMAAMPASSVDAVVCDPPYGLEFMGKEWDKLDNGADVRQPFRGEVQTPDNPYGRTPVRYGYDQTPGAMQEWHHRWATEALRVLKPGGHLLAFGGTRTSHRLACAVEDAGFEIRDTIVWLYGSGFPKSLDVGKAIDKQAGAERERKPPQQRLQPSNSLHPTGFGANGWAPQVDEPVTPDAERWDGWGTALKPAHEPIVVARKPLAGTVAANVLEHGTGGLNVDGCRVEHASDADLATSQAKNPGRDDLVTSGVYGQGRPQQRVNGAGRWPANVALDEQAAAMLDQQSGEGRARGNIAPTRRNGGSWFGAEGTPGATDSGDSGGASRFFYIAKASRAERNAGLAGFEPEFSPTMNNGIGGKEHDPETATPKRNHHPTVKPVSLMRWLVRLVTPPDGLILDPFAGSGTTGIAAILEGFNFHGCEQDAAYADIARARVGWWELHGHDALRIVAEQEAAENEREAVRASGQMELL